MPPTLLLSAFLAGVVPRTFLGALATAGVAAPFHLAAALAGAPKVWTLSFVRGALAFLVWLPLTRLGHAVADHYREPRVRRAFVAVCAVQFHLVFYCSRPLPNTFGLVLLLWAFTCWVQRRFATTVCLLAAATLVFRCDTLLLCGPVGLSILLRRQLSLPRFVAAAVLGAVASVATTVAVDSYFWSRLIWPELEVFWFNVVLNKSSEYGVLPLLWYFTSALPRMLLGTALFIGAALLVPYGRWSSLNVVDGAAGACRSTGVDNSKRNHDPRDLCWELVMPMVVFVALYSLLPHKELRFILYAVPAFNAASAVAVAGAWAAGVRDVSSAGSATRKLRGFFFLGVR